MQEQIEGIVGLKAFALNSNVGVNTSRRAKQRERLIYQMGAEIEQHSTSWFRLLAPSSRLRRRPEAVIERFEAHNAAELAGRQNVTNRLEIRVKPSIVINGQQPSPSIRDLVEFLRFVKRGRHRLVDYNIPASLQASRGKRKMCLIRCSDHNQLNRAYRQQFVQASDYANVRVHLCSLVAFTLHNCRKTQTWHGANHRRVERFPRQTESDKSDFDHETPRSPSRMFA